MEHFIVQIRGLTKKYKNKTVVDNVSLSVEEGKIYGLIGVNGAGKTTLMKMLCGLTKPDEGDIILMGSSNMCTQLEKVGYSIEYPALYPEFDAFENMMAQGILLNCTKKETIYRILELVGLKEIHKKVKTYSLGMKQRLMIALSLLGNPRLLILDEPMNGLDPIGIKQVRDLFYELNKEGISFIISSHILDELSKISHKFGIMDSGKLIKEITQEELHNLNSHKILIEVDCVEKALEILQEEFGQSNIEVNKHTIILSDCNSDQKISNINFKLLSYGIGITKFVSLESDIESYFLKLIRNEKNG